MIIGLAILLFKEAMEEFFPNQKKHLTRFVLLRWGWQIIVLSLILLTGVLGSDQFIYANF